MLGQLKKSTSHEVLFFFPPRLERKFAEGELRFRFACEMCCGA